jgi:hypothetical protein
MDLKQLIEHASKGRMKRRDLKITKRWWFA